MSDLDVCEVYAFVEARLEMDYVRETALWVARSLRAGGPALEVCLQPGDGTRYDLAFVPLQALGTAPPRVKDGKAWDAQCAFGVDRQRGTALVVWPGHGAAGLDLRSGGFEPVYLQELYDTTLGSACALALLFNAVGDAFRPDPVPTTKES